MIFDLPSYLPSQALRTIKMRRGDVVFRQGQPTSGMYRVISGRVTLGRTSTTGEALILHRACPGSYFAEASIFAETYHCEATCTEAGAVLKFSKSAVIHALQTNPKFGTGFTGLLASQVQHYRAHTELLAIRAAKDRVLAAVQAGYLETTVSEFASQINLTREACYRALTALCDDGRLRRDGRGHYTLPQTVTHANEFVCADL